ncbi:MAG: acyltransferase [Bacteroidales bacterium]|nr:acyltransferase [Bacteroidales bacterium]
MTTENKQYNYCLDFIKGVACICIVLMHCEFPGNLGVIVQTMSRFSVPFFFMVSGYFAMKVSRKKILHIAKITLWASLFYLAFALVQHLIWHDMSFKVSKSQALIWLLFNQPVIIAGPLWFCFALLYDYILVSILDHFRFQKYENVAGIIMLVLFFFMGQGIHLIGGGIPVPDFVQGDFGGNIPHMEGGRVPVPNFIYRNFLFEGYAFFMLGRIIQKNKDRIKISNLALLAIIIVSTLLCFAERHWIGREFGVNLFTLPQLLALFIYGINNPTRHQGAVQRLGRDCSMLVYILHPFVWYSLRRVYKAMDVADNLTALYLMPIIVVVLSIALALFCNWFTKTVQSKKQAV